jgi:hypothetical protein
MKSNDQKAALAAERQRKMYGVDDIAQWMTFTLAHYPAGAGMLLASILSDAQEEIAMDRGDSARCTLNRAKRLLSEIMERGLPLKTDRAGNG